MNFKNKIFRLCRTSPARLWLVIFSFLICLIDSESPFSISLRATKKPGCAGPVRDSRVSDWLWLGKVLAPLRHPI